MQVLHTEKDKKPWRVKMPRPRRCRRIGYRPGITYFKPAGIGLSELNEVRLTVDEFESVRLKDHENLDQEQAAERMDISQPTFHRLLNSARKKIADALTNGKAIRIEGGTYKISGQFRGFRHGGSMGEVEKEGALNRKTKELIAVALSIVSHCKWCIAFYVKGALDAGASKEEVMKSCFVAALMGGGPALMYTQLAVKALEDLSK